MVHYICCCANCDVKYSARQRYSAISNVSGRKLNDLTLLAIQIMNPCTTGLKPRELVTRLRVIWIGIAAATTALRAGIAPTT